MPTTFQQLHHQATPLILPNAWDAASALLMEQQGAQAIATSSAAQAWSLGYADGGSLPPVELLAACQRMCRVLYRPLTVDIEHGYSDVPEEVAELAQSLALIGVAGINLEDGNAPPALLAAKLAAIRQRSACRHLFLNARTDVYLAGIASGTKAVAEVGRRAALYEEAGADGLFVPGVQLADEMLAISSATILPLNVMLLPGMASITTLQQAGVRRISSGPAPFLQAYAAVSRGVAGMLQADWTVLQAPALDYQQLNQLMRCATTV